MTNGYASEYTSGVFGSVNSSCCWHCWVATIDFSYNCVSSHNPDAATEPRATCALQPHDRATRSGWCLGMCDVTHYDPLLCNLTSVLTSNPFSVTAPSLEICLAAANRAQGRRRRTELEVAQGRGKAERKGRSRWIRRGGRRGRRHGRPAAGSSWRTQAGARRPR